MRAYCHFAKLSIYQRGISSVRPITQQRSHNAAGFIARCNAEFISPVKLPADYL